MAIEEEAPPFLAALRAEALGLAAKGERFLPLPGFKLKRFVLGRLERAKRFVANRLGLSYRAKRGKRFRRGPGWQSQTAKRFGWPSKKRHHLFLLLFELKRFV